MSKIIGSDFSTNFVRENLKKSVVGYEDETSNLRTLTAEQVLEEINKGESSFFTRDSLVKLKDELEKSEVSEESSKKIANDIKRMEKVIIKGEDVNYEGFFLPKEVKED